MNQATDTRASGRAPLALSWDELALYLLAALLLGAAGGMHADMVLDKRQVQADVRLPSCTAVDSTRPGGAASARVVRM